MPDSHLLNTTNIVNLDTYLANNYVTQDTAQNITGVKTLLSSSPVVYSKNSSDLTSADNYTFRLLGYDSTKNYGELNFFRRGSVSNSEAHLTTRNHSGNVANFAIAINDSGTSSAVFTGINAVAINEGTMNVNRSGNYYYFLGRTDLANSATIPSEVKYEIMIARANDGSGLGQVAWSQDTAGNYKAYLTAYSAVSGTNKGATISVGLNSSGTAFTSAPTPTDTTSTSSVQIATVGWSNTNLSRTDLSNSPYTTNRILSIPQDIKLELNNGSLIRKAGSKFYIPNGFESDGTTPKFDVVTITQDQTSSKPTQTYSKLVHLYLPTSPSSFSSTSLVACFSGATAPTGYTTMFWYDTANNLMKITTNSGSNWYSGFSLPYCIASTTASDGYVSIDQIFNGFGYIGSTVFVLPGVKVQTTFERNADGTYKSEIWSIQSVLTKTRTTSGTNLQWYIQKNISDGTTAINALLHYYSSSTIPSTGPTFSLIWCEEDGGWYSIGSTGIAAKSNYYFLKVFSSDGDSAGKISNFKVCSVDSVVNSNASNFSQAGRSLLAGMSMPSSKYENWTLGASGSTYTAPANGYLTLFKFASGGSAQYAQIRVDYRKSDFRNVPSGQQATPILPLLKGETATVEYNLTGTTQYFRFIYAEGEV